MPQPIRYIRWFNELTIDDIPLVGGKNASLGEMVCELIPQGINIPNGFAVTAEAYRAMLDEANAWSELHLALDDIESPRICRRLHYLRGWSNENDKQIFAGNT